MEDPRAVTEKALKAFANEFGFTLFENEKRVFFPHYDRGMMTDDYWFRLLNKDGKQLTVEVSGDKLDEIRKIYDQAVLDFHYQLNE